MSPSALAGSSYSFDQDAAQTAEPHDHFGYQVAVGNFDCVGSLDIAVAAVGEDTGTGVVTIHYGSTKDWALDPANTQVIWQSGGTSPETDDSFGESMVVGDFNGDGCDDLVIAATKEDWGATPIAGYVAIYEGGPGGLTYDRYMTASTLGGTIEAGAEFGGALAAGDIDGDGYDDLAIGAAGAISGAGRVHVVYGSAAGIDIATGSGFTQADTGSGSNEAGDYFGEALIIGDFDGDGFGDLAVSAPYETPGGGAVQAGYVSVVYGSAAGYDLTSAVGFGLNNLGQSARDYDNFGNALAAGDYDDDGYDDLAASAALRSVNGLSQAGEVYVRYGGASGLTWSYDRLTRSAPASVDRFGHALATGDVDGDLVADLCVGAPYADTTILNVTYTNIGAVDVFGWDGAQLSRTATVSAVSGGYFQSNAHSGFALSSGYLTSSAGHDVVFSAPGVYTDEGAVIVVQPF